MLLCSERQSALLRAGSLVSSRSKLSVNAPMSSFAQGQFFKGSSFKEQCYGDLLI